MSEQISCKQQRPAPKPCRTTAPFWEAARKRRLILQYDPDARQWQFWPRPASVRTGKNNLEWREASGMGVIYSFTNTIVPAPGFDDRAPYLVGLIELDEGVRIVSNLIGIEPDDVKIGMRVRVAWEVLTPDINFPVFEPDI